ncbi:BTB/POZ domain-containing protein 6 isoform X3 [Phyllobates terribilis]|uniref:BTB/POZ domain-containing protein 6 isoform X3 n=1 Tax=Phyllobates terribilis TaxID=111132 RepID=UPI003CCA8252
MPLDPGCLNGRIMKCLTFFLLLPETLKKSKKSARANGKVQACYEIVPLALKRKMAAELYPASANTNIANSNNAAAVTAKKNALQIQQNAPPPPQLQNLNNNNIESTNWQSFHPTLRERFLDSLQQPAAGQISWIWNMHPTTLLRPQSSSPRQTRQ